MPSPSLNDEVDDAPATCLFCGGPEEDDYHMVSCTQCKLWAHFKCAEVTEDVKEVDWYCAKCTPSSDNLLRVPKAAKKTTTKKSGAKSDSGSIRNAGVMTDPSVQQLEIEQLAKENALAKQMEFRAKRLELARIWNEKQLKLEREMREMELQAEREMQEQQLRQEQELLEQQLFAEQEFRRKKEALREQMQNSHTNVKRLMEEEGTVGGAPAEGPTVSNEKKVQHWLDGQKKNKLVGDPRGAYPKVRTVQADEQPKSTAARQHISKPLSEAKKKQQFEEHDSDQEDEDEKEEELAEDDCGNLLRNGRQNGPGLVVARVSKEQLAARQAVSKHLPTFRGEPEIWPLFISSFEYTTEACGFSNLDNLKRLQDSLQGDALEAVRSRLVLPDSVPDIIKDLRHLFGKPEKLLKPLLMKVRNAQAPRVDRLESFIHFGITVKQLCDHLEAAQLNDHLSNPMLVQELVEKLPPSYKLDWVRFKRGKHETPLRMFTDFMTDIVADVSEVSEFSGLSLNEPCALRSQEKGK